MEQMLRGKTSLVTGAARGIGAEIARHFIKEGSVVYLTDINLGGVGATAAQLGPRAIALRMDVRSSTEVRAVIHQVAAERGGIDVLVNNAGVMTQGAFPDTSIPEWNELVAVNLTGVFHGVQAVAPLMMEQGKGSIINIASVSAEKGGGAIGNVWYGTTKAGVVALTKGLSRELGSRGVRINGISPGVVETDMVRHSLTPQVKEKILTRFPLGRLATKEDIANLAAFLASDLSLFVTGQTINVDGGFLNT
jgi:3-oxoacyl-[acyl-carrier protein] reductase